MTLTELRNTCAAYHQKRVNDLTKNTVDLFLLAANNARKNAEKLHSFEWNRCTASLSIDGVTGGALATAVLDPPATFQKIKEVVNVSILRNNVYVPIEFTRSDIEIERERSEQQLNNEYWYAGRYPSDAQFDLMSADRVIVQRAQSLYIFPRVVVATTPNPLSVSMECYGYLNNYTAANYDDTAPSDWFLDQGDNYLQWAIIDDLNYIFQTFVPRQEGNVIPSPKDKRDEAWRDMLLWDGYMVDSHVTRPK
jgi:hypothetical protein